LKKRFLNFIFGKKKKLKKITSSFRGLAYIYKSGLRFRAGIEGLISVLMRAYGLKRCNWKGWEAFESYVGLSVVTYNLQKIASLQ